MRILVADDETNMRWALQRALSKAGYEVETAEDGQSAVEKALVERPDLVLLDLKMPRLNGLEALKQLKDNYPDLLVIMMTAHGSTPNAVDAMKAGAYDYIMKPFDIEELLLNIAKALVVGKLRQQIDYLQNEVNGRSGWGQFIGTSAPMRQVYKLVERVAATSATVLIHGESGTGKELVAHAIHMLSPRRDSGFISVNCAALPETLLESELFGHEKGAFTGAVSRKAGRFELANGGTIFLDEIGELPQHVQAKLLRVLQERNFVRVGGEKTVSVDVRIIAASNRDLLREMAEGLFREDLYYRLSVFPISLPPLRERRDDIPLLIEHFLKMYAPGQNRKLTSAALGRLCSYSWPGNVRELQNFVERMVIICPDKEIGEKCLPDFVTTHRQEQGGIDYKLPPEGLSLEQLEKSFLQQAIEQTNGNQSKAARLLGLSRYSFLYRLGKYDIDPRKRGEKQSETRNSAKES